MMSLLITILVVLPRMSARMPASSIGRDREYVLKYEKTVKQGGFPEPRLGAEAAICWTPRCARMPNHAHRTCHSRFSRATTPAKESPCRRSKVPLPARWYAPGACLWQSAQSGTHE